MKSKTFEPFTRMLTLTIKENIPKEIIEFLWTKIDRLVVKKQTDYLQIFIFSIKGDKLLVEHRQEVPKYRKKYVLEGIKDIYKYRNLRIYAIDEVYYSIMMVSEEY
jgi:hypothetical protein